MGERILLGSGQLANEKRINFLSLGQSHRSYCGLSYLFFI